ncbi:MAG: type II toxin-antitoxin system Phd/YefM family antitoxin [Bacteroidales bacterium]|nr:type II toxin-antitoxin system Phd/YefM family antitoxin [Bacteroidales bacterium]
MLVASVTDLIRNSKKLFELIVSKRETVIIHRQRGADMVLISLDEWNRLNTDDYLHGYKDETAYILSTEANRKHLFESIEQSKQGKTTAIKTEDLWK